jgi:hypothetical protein
MEQIVLRKISHGYGLMLPGTSPLALLACFLAYDTGGTKVAFFIQWVLDSYSFDGFTGGDIYTLRKAKDMIVVEDDLHDDDDVRPQFVEEGLPANPHVFITTSEQMHSILLQWQNILDMNPPPNYVVITQDGEKVTIAPQDALEILKQ